jgi:hypothetical protein
MVVPPVLEIVEAMMAAQRSKVAINLKKEISW